VDLQYRASIVLWLLWDDRTGDALGTGWAIAGEGVAGYARPIRPYFLAVMLVNQLTPPGTPGSDH